MLPTIVRLVHVDDNDAMLTSSKAVVALSGPGGAVFRTFDSSTGDLLVEDRLHEPLEGHLSEPVDLGSRLIFARSVDGTLEKDVYTLTNGRTLHRLDALTGQAKWKWSSEEELVGSNF